MSQRSNEGASVDADGGPADFGGNLPSSPAFTVEGTIDREVAVVTGAKRVGGWRKWTVYVLALGMVTVGLIAPFWRAIVGAL